MTKITMTFFVMLIALSGGVIGAYACPNQELYDNVKFCNDPSGKDSVQLAGRQNITDGAGARPPVIGEVVWGYLQCQHHQIPVGLVNDAAGGILGVPGDVFGSLAQWSTKTGRPFEILAECSIWDLWKAEFYVTHDVDAFGNSADRGRDVYKLEGQSCNSTQNPQDWVKEEDCRAILSD